jgi:hypothetical protein
MNLSLLKLIGPRFVKWCLKTGRTNFLSPAIETNISREKLTVITLITNMMMMMMMMIAMVMMIMIMEQVDPDD